MIDAAASPRPVRRGGRWRHVAVALLLAMTATAATAPDAVPHPPEVRPGVATRDGSLRWADAVVEATGEVGRTVGVDLGLDNGTEDELDIVLSVHGVEVDPSGGPRVRSETAALTLPDGDVTLRPGDRLVLRATAPIPAGGRLLAVRATVTGSTGPATADAFVVVSTGAEPDLRVATRGDDRTVTTTIANRSPEPAVARVAIDARRWVGDADRVEIVDLLVAGDGERVIVRDTPPGVGPVRVGAAAAAGTTEATDETTVWTTRATVVAVALALVLLAAGAVAVARRVSRRSR